MAPTLKEALQDWTDWDGAAHELAVCLGLMSAGHGSYLAAKGVFWSNNDLGNALDDTLNRLVTLGVLQYRDDPDHQFRWNPEFRGYWEK